MDTYFEMGTLKLSTKTVLQRGSWKIELLVISKVFIKNWSFLYTYVKPQGVKVELVVGHPYPYPKYGYFIYSIKYGNWSGFFQYHSVEKREIRFHWSFFREISYLVTSLVKMLHSRNFCLYWVRVNFRTYVSTVFDF